MLAVLALVALGAPAAVLPLSYLAAVTPELWRVDLAERRLPNHLVLPGYLPVTMAVAAHWATTGEPPVAALIGGTGYLLFMLVLAATGGMGMGDVKLAGVIGSAAGLVSPAAAIVAPVTAFALGGVAAIVVLVRGGRGTGIAFGPYMLAGLWLAVGVAWLSPGASST